MEVSLSKFITGQTDLKFMGQTPPISITVQTETTLSTLTLAHAKHTVGALARNTMATRLTVTEIAFQT
jgi:hypothetical protein